MKKNKKENKQEPPKLNIYWIYGAIITILLGMSFFGGGSNFKNLSKTNISEFERYLNSGDVSQVIVINKNLAQISIKEESLSKAEHQRLKSTNIFTVSLFLNLPLITFP